MRILIDTNALVLLVIGLIDPKLINRHKRTSIYSKNDFDRLLIVIQKLENLVVLPNIWTEVDNLLNSFSGNYKYPYIQRIKSLVQLTTEEFLSSKTGVNSNFFMQLGLGDALNLALGKDYDLLITADFALSDVATANDIQVYDLVQVRNKEFRGE